MRSFLVRVFVTLRRISIHSERALFLFVVVKINVPVAQLIAKVALIRPKHIIVRSLPIHPSTPPRRTQIRALFIIVVARDPDKSPEARHLRRFTPRSRKEQILRLVVAFQPMQKREQRRVGGVREEVVEVDLGELGGRQGADGRVGRGAGEEDGEGG